MSLEVSSHGTERIDFEQVFVEHAPFAWRVLRRFGVAESDLPDACQDAFIVVHRKLGEFEGRSHLRTWLYRICARVASDYRKRAHRRYETEPLSQEPAVGGDQLRTAELAQLCALLERALDGLDDDKRQVFVLYELEDLSMAQIAELLDCPIKTAFSRLYVARERVNAALRRAGCAALILAFDPLPMRATAQPPLASALDATGIATPSAAQLSAQLTALAPKLVATSLSVSSAPVLLSTGALAVAAAFAVTFASTTVPVRQMPQAVALTRIVNQHVADVRAASVADEPSARVPDRVADVHVAVDPASASADATPVPVEPPALPRAQTPARKKLTPRVAPPAPAAPPQLETAPSPTQWIEAPSVTPPTPVAPATGSSTGLEEVLSATSIRPLMRVGPRSIANTTGGATDEAANAQWALLPDSARKTNQP